MLLTVDEGFAGTLEQTQHFRVWRQKVVAKIVHCGLPHDSLKLLCLVCPDYYARKISKELSISIVGVNNKLRRLSSVGSTFPVKFQEWPLSRLASSL